MPTIQQAESIVARVKARLAEEEHNGVHLEVADHKVDEDWLYVVVVPTKPNVRASDHARLMSQIERELREQGDDKVLLVPALEE